MAAPQAPVSLSERLEANAHAIRVLVRRGGPVPALLLRALAEDLTEQAREAMSLELRIHLGAEHRT